MSACPYCPDGHRDPETCPWAVWVGPERDGDGEPVTLRVSPTGGQHVAESDAEWAREKLNAPAPYDSRPDTWEHIATVRRYLDRATRSLIERGDQHDRSKLEEPELSVFDRVTPQLATLEYGSDEYRAALADMGPALRHHYAHNRHHPEHNIETGIAGMSLLDLIEMLCDWKAAGERHADGGDLARSIELNQERFGYSDELKSILLATARELRFL